MTLPNLTHGRYWELYEWKSTPRRRKPDRRGANLVARTGRTIGYLSEYDNGWGINVATDRGGFKALPGVFASEERAAAALLRALRR